MNARDRLMAVLRHEETDSIPVTIYTALLRRGQVERDLRNMGLCLVEIGASVYGIENSNVTMETIDSLASFSVDDRYATIPRQKHTVNRAYKTPRGSVREKCKWGYATWEWPTEWVLKTREDYEVIKYIIDDTEYFLDASDFINAQESMGGDGIVVGVIPKSPIQAMLLDLMGYTRFSLEYVNNRHEFDELYALLKKKQLELYKVVADSPAEAIWMDENLNGIVIGPTIFEKYSVPFYNEAARILHARSKIVLAHMDGRLKCLRDSITKTEIDVVEGFTPPPIGDMSIKEARDAWEEKVLWTNFPATASVGSELTRIEKETLSLLRQAAPGDGFALGITEDIGDIRSSRYMEILSTITRTVTKNGKYPINRL
jgi:hypothetical protein